MKIKMLTSVASPEFALKKNDIIESTDYRQSIGWLNRGIAIPYIEPVETAILELGEEAAAIIRPKKKRGKRS